MHRSLKNNLSPEKPQSVLRMVSSVAVCLLETNSVLFSFFSRIFTKEKLKEL